MCIRDRHNGSGRREWNGYLDEAERNRDAVASLGIVPDLAANVGQSLRVLGPRRLVLAYTPGELSLIHISEPTRPY